MFVQVEQVNKTYHTGGHPFHALKQINFELERGQIGAILGPSGSGKSTLLNVLGGIDHADEGKVTVGGQVITGMNADRLTDYRREHVGFVFQFYNLIPHLTVEENVEVTANISSSPLEMDAILHAVGMTELRRRFPRELSGGQQQRVSIARAIIKNPALLLCDEPTGALDYATSKDILKLLEEVNRDFGTTILMITHNHALADMAHRVLRMRSGEIVENTLNAQVLPAERIDW
jgi:putative ABC transport system ATP-binding protein